MTARDLFAFLPSWQRIRKIIAGRHGGPDVYYYTTPEAVAADFPQTSSEEYRSAVAALSSFPEHTSGELCITWSTIGVAREGFGLPLVLGPSKR